MISILSGGLCLLRANDAEENKADQAVFSGTDDAGKPVPNSKNTDSQLPQKNSATVLNAGGTPGEAAPKDVKVAESQDKNPDAAAPETPAETKKDETPATGEASEPAEIIPPAPEPTAEQLQQRDLKALDYRSLAEQALNFPVTGSLTSRYRARFAGQGDHDQDLYDYLSLDVGNKDTQWATGHLDLRFADDLNNSRTGLNSDIFAGVLDTYKSNMDTRLYSCYVDFNKVNGFDFIRAGRQFNYDTPDALEFDGLRLETAPVCGAHEVQCSIYGGIPVHLDESSVRNDWLVGAAVDGKPWESARLRLDYILLNDDLTNYDVDNLDLVTQSLNPPGGAARDNLFALSMWQTLKNPDMNLFGRIEMLGDEAREATARATYLKPEWQLQCVASYDVWFKEQNHLATEIDPFTNTLNGQEPYQEGNLTLTKEWADHYNVECGALVRRFLPGSTDEEFNHEFDCYNITFGVHDLPVKGLSASATGYWYEGKQSSPSAGTFGGDISYAWNKNLRTSAGASYNLYKYDLFQNVENEDVRTYYFKQRWRPKRWASLDFDYEYERSLSLNFHTVMLTFRLMF
jgi:hypothetical protein